MKWIVSGMKWIMLVSGALTCTMLYAAVKPRAALQGSFGDTLDGPVAEIVVRNWGVLIGLMAAMLIYGAFNAAVRPLVLVVAGLSKVAFISFVLAFGRQFLGQQVGIAIVSDVIQVSLFIGYLVAAPRRRHVAVASTVAALLLFTGTAASAQTWRPPADNQRCPSKWGAGDQRGSGNHMKPETVLRAARLIRTGEVFELGRVLSESMPIPTGRRFEIFTKRTRNDPGSNRRGSNEELVVAEIGQIGTQFDTFSHQMIGSSLYNCFTLDDTASRTGFTKLGVDQVGALMTRGVLLDIAALKGVPMLAEAYQITPQDLEQAVLAQKLTLQPGDALLVHTGWGTLWGKENARYQRSSPGIGTAAAEWLARQDPMLVGADNPAVEISPNPDPQLAGPVHQILLVVNGIHVLENLRLDELAARRAYEFALIVQPLKIQGGTGSTVAPVAVR